MKPKQEIARNEEEKEEKEDTGNVPSERRCREPRIDKNYLGSSVAAAASFPPLSCFFTLEWPVVILVKEPVLCGSASAAPDSGASI